MELIGRKRSISSFGISLDFALHINSCWHFPTKPVVCCSGLRCESTSALLCNSGCIMENVLYSPLTSILFFINIRIFHRSSFIVNIILFLQ